MGGRGGEGMQACFWPVESVLAGSPLFLVDRLSASWRWNFQSKQTRKKVAGKKKTLPSLSIEMYVVANVSRKSETLHI